MATIPEIHFDDVTSFFQERAPNSAQCQLCGASKWNVMYVAADEDPQVIATTYGLPVVLAKNGKKPVNLTESIQSIATAGVAVIPLSCENCGIMRVMDVRPLVAWKNEKIAEVANGEPKGSPDEETGQ